MVMHVYLEQPGAPQVMQLRSSPAQAPGAGEVWLEQAAIGVNPLDLSSAKATPRLPCPRVWAWKAQER